MSKLLNKIKKQCSKHRIIEPSIVEILDATTVEIYIAHSENRLDDVHRIVENAINKYSIENVISPKLVSDDGGYINSEISSALIELDMVGVIKHLLQQHPGISLYPYDSKSVEMLKLLVNNRSSTYSNGDNIHIAWMFMDWPLGKYDEVDEAIEFLDKTIDYASCEEPNVFGFYLENAFHEDLEGNAALKFTQYWIDHQSSQVECVDDIAVVSVRVLKLMHGMGADFSLWIKGFRFLDQLDRCKGYLKIMKWFAKIYARY